MAATTKRRPYAVFRYFDADTAIAYYERQLLRPVVDVDYLRGQIAEAKTEVSEKVISQHATKEEAEQAAAARYSGPGVTFRAEYHDVGDLNARCEHGVSVFRSCPECD